MAELLRRVAVLMVSYNTTDALRDSLGALASASADLEVVVVDNGSSDGSPEMVEDVYPWARLARAPGNIGFGAGINLAARDSERDFLLTLNPDCVITPQDVRLMAARLDADPALGYVGPQVVLESGAVDHACLRADPDVVGSALYLSRVARLFPDSASANRYSLRHLDYDEEQPLLAGTGACLMVRASAFRRSAASTGRSSCMARTSTSAVGCASMATAASTSRQPAPCTPRASPAGSAAARCWSSSTGRCGPTTASTRPAAAPGSSAAPSPPASPGWPRGGSRSTRSEGISASARGRRGRVR